MNPKTARRILTGYRPSDVDSGSPAFRKALKAVAKAPDLQGEFDAQRAFDRASALSLLAVQVPPERDAKLREYAAGLAQTKRRALFGEPAMVAVGVGFLLLIGVLIWHFVGQAGAFPDEAVHIATEGAAISSDDYESLNQTAGSLGDWLALKGMDSFYVPPEFKDTRIDGVKIFTLENEPVAALHAAGGRMNFFIFRATPFGINLPSAGAWRYGEFDQSAAAIRESDGTCFIMQVRGTREDAANVIRKQQSEHGGQ